MSERHFSEVKSGGGSSPRIAVVLSGGGARGAYEAGVLSYLFDDLPRRLGRPVRFDIVTGTSVGAVHACYIAATLHEENIGKRLIEIWQSLALESAFKLGLVDLFRLPLRLTGILKRGELERPQQQGGLTRVPGLLDTRPLEAVVMNRIPWGQLRRNIDSGSLHALAIAATEIATGRSVVFIDNPSGTVPQWARDPFVVARPARMRPRHALASAALPLLFPSIRIDRAYYCDGGLRLNTPLAPALRLGADRVLVIGLRHRTSPRDEDHQARRREASYTSAVYLAGKTLNALMLDRIEYDLDRMRLFNAILETGIKTYGPDFLPRINKTIIEHREMPYRIVQDLFLHPSLDLGTIAADCLDHRPRGPGLQGWITRKVARYAASGSPGEADLLSYLFFDRCYADHLIELGRQDGEQAADDLIEFFA
jgi:NTE family protein